VLSSIYSPFELPMTSKFITLAVLAPPLLSQTTEVTTWESG